MKSSFTSLGLSLAAAGAVAAALFVQRPVSPSPSNGSAQTPVNAPANANAPVMAKAKAKSPTGNAYAAIPAGRPFVVDVLAVASFGNGADELGRTLPSEASPEAPMSLTVDGLGNVYVLDQVNERVQIYPPTGGMPRTVHFGPHVARTAQDLVVDPAGGLVLLDRLVERALIFTDATGAEKKRVALVGQGVSEGGAVTALFAAPDGFWVELEHATIVRVALPNGDADPARPTMEGRPTINGTGTVLRAARDPQGAAMVSAIGVGMDAFVHRIAFDRPVLQLAGLEGDAAGNVWLAAHLARESPIPPYTLYDSEISVVELSRDGLELGRVMLPAPEGDAEQLRSLVVGADGAVYHLHVGLTVATLRRAK